MILPSFLRQICTTVEWTFGLNWLALMLYYFFISIEFLLQRTALNQTFDLLLIYEHLVVTDELFEAIT